MMNFACMKEQTDAHHKQESEDEWQFMMQQKEERMTQLKLELESRRDYSSTYFKKLPGLYDKFQSPKEVLGPESSPSAYR